MWHKWTLANFLKHGKCSFFQNNLTIALHGGGISTKMYSFLEVHKGCEIKQGSESQQTDLLEARWHRAQKLELMRLNIDLQPLTENMASSLCFKIYNAFLSSDSYRFLQ